MIKNEIQMNYKDKQNYNKFSNEDIKMKNLNLTLAALIIAFTFIGCTASMNDVLKEKNEGTTKVYPVNQNDAWEIAITVLRWEDCEMIEEHKNSGYMLTKIDEESLLWRGESLIGVWVDSVSSDKTKVTVVSKRKHEGSIATGLTESTFHETYYKAVDFVKKGLKLPLEKP